MADAPQLWGIKKTLKVSVPVVVVGALIVLTYLPHDEAVKVSKLKGGECIMLPETSVVNKVQKRDCDRTHEAEVYAAFPYPGSTIAGEPSPEENCTRVPDGLTEEEAAYYERVVEILNNSGKELLLLSNNPDTSLDRDYACVIATPEQQGRFLDEIRAQGSPPTTTTGG